MKPRYAQKFERAMFKDDEKGSRWVTGDIEETHWYPVGGHPFDDEIDEFGEWTDRYLPRKRACRYCNEPLRLIEVDSLDLQGELERHQMAMAEEVLDLCPWTNVGPSLCNSDVQVVPDEVMRALCQYIDPVYRLWVCAKCGWWQWFSVEFYRGGSDSTVVTPIVRDFEKALPEGCTREIAEHVVRRPDHLTQLSPKQLERFVADIFRANHSYSDVQLVGGPGDGGVDVLFIDDGQNEWMVQVKRRSRTNACEGVEVVRSLIGTLVYEGAPCGIVVSTADHFSHFAHIMATEAPVRLRGLLHTIRLIDRHALAEVAGPALIDIDGWRRPLQENLLCYPDNTTVLDEYCGLAVQRIRNSFRESSDASMRQLSLFSPGQIQRQEPPSGRTRR